MAELGPTGKLVSRLGFGGAPAGLTNYLGKYTPGTPLHAPRSLQLSIGHSNLA
jgi:hypothetical protein